MILICFVVFAPTVDTVPSARLPRCNVFRLEVASLCDEKCDAGCETVYLHVINL